MMTDTDAKMYFLFCVVLLVLCPPLGILGFIALFVIGCANGK